MRNTALGAPIPRCPAESVWHSSALHALPSFCVFTYSGDSVLPCLGATPRPVPTTLALSLCAPLPLPPQNAHPVLALALGPFIPALPHRLAARALQPPWPTALAPSVSQTRRSCAAAAMADRKAVIKNADMSEDLRQDAIDCATQVFDSQGRT